MNFFDAQDRARRTTRRLVFVYVLAAAMIVLGVTLVVGAALFNFTQAGYGITLAGFVEQQAPILLGTAIAASLLIVGATLYKTAVLSAGGGRVAKDLGGTQISNDVGDPLRQRLRNVVEEMAIAASIPVPEIYVLERESGINAFAAGYAPGDAAIAVTRGALELLDRDELQGVIGHEFSHILNGDMRLNIRLMGVLFGIMVLGLIGRMVLRGGRYGAFSSSRRSRGAPAVLIIGLGLAVLGAIGVFFARIVKSGVSRQREYLADASAVQFTRQTGGLANALKKIGGYEAHSYLRETDPEEVSHMLFGTGSRLSGLFATHPPLTDRIRALDPTFKESDYPQVDLRNSKVARDTAAAQEQIAGVSAAVAGAAVSMLPERVASNVGQPTDQQLEIAGRLRRSVPETLYDAAHSSELAYLLTIALILDRSGRGITRQLALADDRLGPARARLVRQYYEQLLDTGPEYRLPLLEIAFPALRRRPPPQLAYLVELASRMIEVDGDIDLYEYCFYRILVSSLAQALEPARPRRHRRATRKPVRDAAVDLLRIIAQQGHENQVAAERAFHAGLAVFGAWAQAADFHSDQEFSAARLDRHLDLLVALNSEGRQMLITAVSAVVLHDRKITIAEIELMRAVCASLDCPLPPLLLDRTIPPSNR